MMAELVKIPYEGGVADAEQLEVNVPELSSNLPLPDGKVLKVDVSVNNLFRLVGKRDEQGEPIYVFNVQVKVTTVATAATEAVKE